MRKILVGCFLLFVLIVPGCARVSDSGDDQTVLRSRVDSIFSDFLVPESPGAVAMVIRNGEVVHAAGYGLAEVGSARALSRETPMRLGSVGKQFTSMAVMMLAERGELGFEDLVTEWVPELSRFPGIQVQHLLHHTSGLPDYYDLGEKAFIGVAGSDGNPLLTNADVVTFYEGWGEPLFEPGERFEYSNPGYDVLALIVERISGQTFGEFLAENVFEPLGMETAAVRERPETDIPNRAVGYRWDEPGGGWIENDDHSLNWIVGAGGVYASLNDLYLWDQALYTETLVAKETLDLAFAPTTLKDGSLSEYGFAWRLSDRLGHKAVHHGGSWVGFRAAIVRYIDDGLTVVVVSNASADTGELADELARLFLIEVP